MDIYHYSKTINTNRIVNDIKNVLDVIAGIPQDFRERPSKSNISVSDNVLFSMMTRLPYDSIYDYLDNSCLVDCGRHIVVVLDKSHELTLDRPASSSSYFQYNEVSDKDEEYTITVIDKAYLYTDNFKKNEIDQNTYYIIYNIIDKYKEIKKVMNFIASGDLDYKTMLDFFVFIYTILRSIIPLNMDDFKDASYMAFLNRDLDEEDFYLSNFADMAAFKFVLNGAKEEDYPEFVKSCTLIAMANGDKD